jgi:hypothetical protein
MKRAISDAISRPQLVGLLRGAAEAVETARMSVAHKTSLPEALKTLARTARSLQLLAPDVADHLNAATEHLQGELRRTRHGNRWALAEELERLTQLRVASWRAARVLVEIGVCKGQTPDALKRCQARMRKLRERLRRRDGRPASSRETCPPCARSASAPLRSDPGIEPKETTSMPKKKIRKTTTTTVEEFEDKARPDLEDDDELLDDDEAEDDEEDEDEPKPPVRPRRRSR